MLLDTRFVKTNLIYEKAAYSYTSPLYLNTIKDDQYITLKRFETYFGTIHIPVYNKSYKIIIPLTCEPDQVYDVHAYIDIKNATNFDIQLMPNNHNYVTTFRRMEFLFHPATTGPKWGCHMFRPTTPEVGIFMSDPQYGTSDKGPLYSRWMCYTKTEHKFCITFNSDIDGCALQGITWHDKTTKWTKLGCLYLPHLYPHPSLGAADFVVYVKRCI